MGGKHRTSPELGEAFRRSRRGTGRTSAVSRRMISGKGGWLSELFRSFLIFWGSFCVPLTKEEDSFLLGSKKNSCGRPT